MSDAAPDWFRAPERMFRTAAFWFWHRIPTEPEIRTQLADMRRKGIGAVMIQARPALPLDAYLSPAYLAAYRVAAAEIRRLGLSLTIYDEYGWMSGHGGGRTVRGADHLRERHLFWTSRAAGETRTELSVTGIRSPFLEFLGETGRAWLYDGGNPCWGDWRTVLVVAHGAEIAGEDDIRVLATRAAPAEAGSTGCRLAVTHGALPPGTIVTAFVSARCVTSRLINYLLPEAAERFAATAYAPLVAAAAGAAEDIFFDHPHAGFYQWSEHHGPVGNSLLDDGAPAPPDAAAALLSLARDVGPRTPALRAGFFDGYSRRLHAAFFGTLSAWARERGLGFTGHELLTHVGGWALHDGLTGFDPRTMPGVDYFGLDAYRSATTADAADFAPQLAAKLGDSVARAHGRSRCSVEQYATGRPAGRPTLAGQWDLTAARFRAQAIRHLLLGARRVILHAVNVTDGTDDARLLANPRFDFPPAYNFEPWWEDCPGIFDELPRLSAFLEAGEPVRDVALLYPLETIRAAGPAHGCGRHFGWWAEALAGAGLGYDIVDETMLPSVTASGSKYRTVILPAAERLARAGSVDLLSGFMRRGGRVLASGMVPIATRDRGAIIGFAAAPGDRADCHAFHHMPHADSKAIAAAVRNLERPLPRVRFADAGATWCAMARCGALWRVAVFNDAADARRLDIDAGDGAADLQVWDAATGDLRPLPMVGRGPPSMAVGAQRVVCLTLEPGKPPTRATSPSRPAAPAIPVTPRSATVLLQGWTLQIGGAAPVPIAVDRGWDQQGWPRFAGTGIYRRRVRPPFVRGDQAWLLRLPDVRDTAELWFDGVLLGRHVAGEACFMLPPGRLDGVVELRVRNTAANRYYAGTGYDAEAPRPSGLVRPPILVATAV